MKKLMVLFLIAIVSFFLFSGCQGLIPSEGEGEEEPEGIVVDIQGSVQVEGKTYLSRGTHDITVTFPAPVTGIVKGYITYCTGDYSKKVNGDGTEVIFFPNTDRTAWTGSGSFQDSASLCCASYLEITSGSCEEEACIRIPIIIDSEPPYATIEVCLSDCTCDGCELSFTSTTTSLDCAEDTANCGDSCSGLAGWSLALYEKYPFDDCCETPCAEPVFTCSGTDCPIECTTGCLTEDLYYALVTLVDHTGNEVTFGTKIEIDPEDCSSLVLSDLEAGDCLDTPWNSGFVVCEEMIYCYELPFEEDFDGESLTTIPDGWTTDRPSNWFIVDSTLAGGFSPEMRFSWTPTFSSGSSRLISPCIDAKEASGLELSFKHFVNHFITGYILKVQVSADNGNTWVDSPWSIAPTGDIGPATVNVDLSAYDGETILIAWVIDVAPTLIDYWYIDDIIVQ